MESEDNQKEITSERVIALLLEENRRLEADKQKRVKSESISVSTTMQALVSESNEFSVDQSVEKNNFNFNKRMKMNRKRKFQASAQERCSHCNRIGHSRERCWSLIGFPPGHSAHNQQSNISTCRQPSFQANIVQPKDESYLLLTSKSTSELNSSELNFMQPNTWWIDSGATHHYCPDRSWFSEYHEIHPYEVRMGNNTTSTAVGFGTIHYVVHHNGERKQYNLRNVVHVPTLRLNLLSVQQLDEEGIDIHFINHVCHIADRDGNILCTGVKHETSRLYYVQLQINQVNQEEVQTNVAEASNPSVSPATTVQLSNSSYADGLTQLQSGHTAIQKQSKVATNLNVPVAQIDNGVKLSKRNVTLKKKSENESIDGERKKVTITLKRKSSNEIKGDVESSTKRIKERNECGIMAPTIGSFTC